MSKKARRWYDKDPVLSKSMHILETSTDEFQIKMAVNLIKIIIEHNIETNSFASIDDIMAAVDDGRISKGSTRWYDIDNTLRTAIQMLENCPAETQSVIIPQMASLIVEKFNSTEEDDDDDDDE